MNMERKLWKKSHSWGGQFMRIVSKPNTYVFAAFSDHDHVVGYAVVALTSLIGQVSKIIVVPEHRRKGIGSELLRRVLTFVKAASKCSSVILYVDCSNIAAQTLYTKMGFVVEDVLEDYYSLGVHAYRMRVDV